MMTEPAKYRVAVIGRTGKGAYGHSIDTVWLNHPRAEIVAVADENDAGRTAALKRLGAKTGYADFRKMLEVEKPQIVSVADRWVDQHRDMVVACAERGASLFLEKPLARTLAEADEMVAACDRHHVKCALAHQTRYAPRVQVVKELLTAGRIGDVLEIHAHGKCDARGGGEDLMVLGTHTFDLIRFLIGDPSWCFARILANDKPAGPADVVSLGEGIGSGIRGQINVTYGFATGAVAHFTTHVARAGAGARYWVEVRGSKGLLHIGYGGWPQVYLCEDPSWMPGQSKVPWQTVTAAGIGKPERDKPGTVAQSNRWIVDDLIRAIEEDRQPLGSIADGRAALEMILAVYESHRQNRPVTFPLTTRRHPLQGW